MATAKNPVSKKAPAKKLPAKDIPAKKSSPQKSVAKKSISSASKPKTAAPSTNVSQSEAVKKDKEVKVAGFQFEAAPSGFKPELVTDTSVKRFHGTRLLYSWLPQEFFQNNTDRFGYMFPGLNRSALPYTDANRNLLERLGDEMGNKDDLPGAADSAIPAGYTYLGQFIDHDITLDVNSDISKLQDATKIPNMRSPSLDLDAIYGEGPALNAFLYDHREVGALRGIKLLLGQNQNTGAGGPTLNNGTAGNPVNFGNNFDVQRTVDRTAIIGDFRNDENLIVSQLHHANIKFHNKVADHLNVTGFIGDPFTHTKTVVTHHYQWVVVHDFLKRIADPAIVDKTLRNGPKFFRGRQLFMPVEFSVAAYRFGHSMIRNRYFVNGPLVVRPATLRQIFDFIRGQNIPVLSNWVIDFNLYFQARTIPAGVSFNMARKLDTRLAVGLEELPGETGSFMTMLAKRNLVRGMALGVPSGQAVAKAIRATVLTEQELLLNNTAAENTVLQEANKLLLKKTPLWYYILKEAEVKHDGKRLGTVGSTILAETFVRLLRDDPNSFLNATPKFKPSLSRFNGRPVGDFDMTDILQFAALLSLD